MEKCLNDLSETIIESHTINNKRKVEEDCQEGQSGNENLTVIDNDENEIPIASSQKERSL